MILKPMILKPLYAGTKPTVQQIDSCPSPNFPDTVHSASGGAVALLYSPMKPRLEISCGLQLRSSMRETLMRETLMRETFGTVRTTSG
jgi:hypothetical protein